MAQMNPPRSAAASGRDFPYTSSLICYFQIDGEGNVRQGKPDAELIDEARAGRVRLFAVWPGHWSSDLFEIDDLDELARGLGLVNDPRRTGLDDHVHDIEWEVHPFESNPQGTYISISLKLKCGCSISSIDAFASQMREQRGWDVATSSGWGSSGPPDGPKLYTVRVRRRSLER